MLSEDISIDISYVIVPFLDDRSLTRGNKFSPRPPQHNLPPLVEVCDINTLSSNDARRYLVGYGVAPIPRCQ